MAAELDRVKTLVSATQFHIYDYLLQGNSVVQTRRALGVSAAQVYLAKHRVSAAVKRAVREIEVEMGVHPPQCCYGGRA